MSAFLGPIHFMMYNKIQKQNDLLDEVIAYMQDNNIITDLSSKLKEKYGENEREALESVIDQNAIHSWLNNQVNIAESRLAYALKLILEKDKVLLEKVADIFYSNGLNNRLECADIIVVEELFKILQINLLDGMPCDGGIIIQNDDGSEIMWEVNLEVHKPYYDNENIDVEHFFAMRDKWLQGFFAGSFNIEYSRLGLNLFKIMEV